MPSCCFPAPLVSGSKQTREVTVPRVSFTPNLNRHITCPPREVSAATVRAALGDPLRPDRDAFAVRLTLCHNAETKHERQSLGTG